MPDDIIREVYAAIFCRRLTKPLQAAAGLLEAATGDRPRSPVELVAIATDVLELPPEAVLGMTPSELVARLQRAVAGPQPSPAPERTAKSQPKKSTKRGEGRTKLIAALTKHHRYADGGCLNQEPIGNNELAKAAGVSASTASAFFDEKFQGHEKYIVLCRDAGKLTAALKLLNDEFAPYHLLGAGASDLAAPEQDDADSD